MHDETMFKGSKSMSNWIASHKKMSDCWHVCPQNTMRVEGFGGTLIEENCGASTVGDGVYMLDSRGDKHVEELGVLLVDRCCSR